MMETGESTFEEELPPLSINNLGLLDNVQSDRQTCTGHLPNMVRQKSQLHMDPSLWEADENPVSDPGLRP